MGTRGKDGQLSIELRCLGGTHETWVSLHCAPFDDLAGGPLLDGGDLLFLAALPLLGTIVATLVARLAVLRALRASL